MESERRVEANAVPHVDARMTAGHSLPSEEKAENRWLGEAAEPPPPPPPTVLLVGKCALRATGNATTLDRLGHAVRSGGWQCLTRDPDSLRHTTDLQALVTQHNIVAALGLHAYRSAHALLTCQELGVPYVLMFGGTDVNECSKETAKREVMERVVMGARSVIAFNAAMFDTARQVWPSLHQDQMWIMPQAVLVNPEPDFDVLSYLEAVESAHLAARTHDVNHQESKTHINNRDAEESREICKIESEYNGVIENGCLKENTQSQEKKGVTAQNTVAAPMMNGIQREPLGMGCSGALELPTVFQPLVLLVAGLRPVKDVLYLTEAWSRWQKTRGGRGRFLIIGPALDPPYAALVHAQVDRLSGVRICPSLAPGECQALVSSATVLVNSSRSESMPNALLEAMALCTPILARDIPGNASLVTHGHTGLLYSCPDTFLKGLDALLQDLGLRERLVAAAKGHVTRFHSLEQEKDLLLKILGYPNDRKSDAGRQAGKQVLPMTTCSHDKPGQRMTGEQKS